MISAKEYGELLAILLKNSNLGPIEKEQKIEPSTLRILESHGERRAYRQAK